jgi:predicted nuclease of predicted toxin-antitoxin system
VKIKIDENLAQAHRRILEAAGLDVADVHDERLAGASDHVLWSHVCEEGRFLVTLDTDFSDIRQFLPGSHPGILLMRTTHPSVSAVSMILHRVLEERDLASVAGCLIVADEMRTRTRGPWRGSAHIAGFSSCSMSCPRRHHRNDDSIEAAEAACTSPPR